MTPVTFDEVLQAEMANMLDEAVKLASKVKNPDELAKAKAQLTADTVSKAKAKHEKAVQDAKAKAEASKKAESDLIASIAKSLGEALTPDIRSKVRGLFNGDASVAGVRFVVNAKVKVAEDGVKTWDGWNEPQASIIRVTTTKATGTKGQSTGTGGRGKPTTLSGGGDASKHGTYPSANAAVKAVYPDSSPVNNAAAVEKLGKAGYTVSQG